MQDAVLGDRPSNKIQRLGSDGGWSRHEGRGGCAAHYAPSHTAALIDVRVWARTVRGRAHAIVHRRHSRGRWRRLSRRRGDAAKPDCQSHDEDRKPAHTFKIQARPVAAQPEVWSTKRHRKHASSLSSVRLLLMSAMLSAPLPTIGRSSTPPDILYLRSTAIRAFRLQRRGAGVPVVEKSPSAPSWAKAG